MDTFHLFGYFCPASSPKELKALRTDISLRNEEEKKKKQTQRTKSQGEDCYVTRARSAVAWGWQQDPQIIQKGRWSTPEQKVKANQVV